MYITNSCATRRYAFPDCSRDFNVINDSWAKVKMIPHLNFSSGTHLVLALNRVRAPIRYWLIPNVPWSNVNYVVFMRENRIRIPGAEDESKVKIECLRWVPTGAVSLS